MHTDSNVWAIIKAEYQLLWNIKDNSLSSDKVHPCLFKIVISSAVLESLLRPKNKSTYTNVISIHLVIFRRFFSGLTSFCFWKGAITITNSDLWVIYQKFQFWVPTQSD